MKNTRNNREQSGNIDRKSNLELLRIVATLFVIIIHYNRTGTGNALQYTQTMPLHHQILLFFEMLAICAVNIFVMISGFFLCTAKYVRIWKILRLYIDALLVFLMVCVLASVADIVPIGFMDMLLLFLPLTWYLAIYSGMYLLSPFLNKALESKNKTQFRFLLGVMFFVLSVWPSLIEFLTKVLGISLLTMSPISNIGSADGYTLVNFVLMYSLGAYCRKFGQQVANWKKGICAMFVYIGCAVINMLYADYSFGLAVSYCNPLVVIQTVAIFIAFQNMQIHNKGINAIASCSFGVYLLHAVGLFFWQIERCVTGNPIMIPIHILATTVLIYAACALPYWVYQKLLTPVYAVIENKLKFLSYNIDGFWKQK